MTHPTPTGAARRSPLRLLVAVCLSLGGGLSHMAPSTAMAQAPRTITLESPAPGAAIVSPVEVRGRVTVAPFENNLVGTVYDAAGQIIGQDPVTVTPDTPGSLGGPGSFSAHLSFSATSGGTGRVEVADVSQADGSILASASVSVSLPGAAPPPPDAGATSWLDQPLSGAGWNAPGGAIPEASAAPGEPDATCAATARPAETPEDGQVTGAGWRLFDAYQSGWDTRIVFGLTEFDGMCRPLGFQGFVFSGGVFAGTLAPQPMDARTDGAYSSVRWISPPPPGAVSSFLVDYSRYLGPQDALCCPSATSTVTFEVRVAGIVPGGRVLVPVRVQTLPNQPG